MTGRSLRARLTLWYTAALGVLLVITGSMTYIVLKRAARSDSIAFLTETAGAVAASLRLALGSVPTTWQSDSLAPRWAADRTLENHRYRDIGVAVFQRREGAEGTHLLLLAVDSTSGTTRYFGGAAGWQRAGASAVRTLAAMDTDVTTIEPQRERVVSVPVETERGVFVVSVSQSLAARDALFERFRETMWIGFPVVLLLAMAGGLGLAAVSLRPVDEMRDQAEQITASNLHRRLPVPSSDDELSRLSRTFNALLDRVADAFEQRRRFTADASHELRTPVAIIIGESELALSADRPAGQYREALRIIHGEARRLTTIVEGLFMMARRDAAEATINPEPLYLEEMVGDCVDAISGIARARRITLEYLPVSEVPCLGDDAMLRRLVMNLLDNAIKYTPPGGSVVVDVERGQTGGAVMRISNTGPGIAPEHQERIFERFYRVQHTSDRSGIEDSSGAGLGLPIASWIAKAHGGSLRLVKSDVDGTVFELTLPGREGRAWRVRSVDA